MEGEEEGGREGDVVLAAAHCGNSRGDERTETEANTWHTWPLGAALPLIEFRCICRSAAAAAAASVCASACSAYGNLSGGAHRSCVCSGVEIND